MKLVGLQVLGQLIDLQEGLEHSAGSPGGRHKFQEPTLLRSSLVAGEITFARRGVQPMNPIARRARPLQADKRGIPPEQFELRPHLGLIDFQGVHLLEICFLEAQLFHLNHPARLSRGAMPRFRPACSKEKLYPLVPFNAIKKGRAGRPVPAVIRPVTRDDGRF